MCGAQVKSNVHTNLGSAFAPKQQAQFWNSKEFPSSAMGHLPTDQVAGFLLFVSLLKVTGPPAAVKIAPIGEALCPEVISCRSDPFRSRK